MSLRISSNSGEQHFQVVQRFLDGADQKEKTGEGSKELVPSVSDVTIEYQWYEKRPRRYVNHMDGTVHYAQSRKVFIGESNSLPRLVVKIEDAKMRGKKLELVLPHAEEIAYKICKMFHWNTVPKSKVLHQYSALYIDPTRKLQKYIRLMAPFKNMEYPCTFTFQAFVAGQILPDVVTSKTRDPNPSSYQKAYLLGMVLGKFDARGDNAIHNHQTGELFEIDNEYIGKEGYKDSGILNQFRKLKRQEVPLQILNDVLSTQMIQLAQIRDKYKLRDDCLITSWSTEPYPEFLDCGSKKRDEYWSRIMENLTFLKMSIHALRERKGPVTIEKLARGVNKLYLMNKAIY